MEIMGNIFTQYNYTTTDIGQEETADTKTISSIKSKLRITIDKATEEILLPEHSPFADWKEARRFAGPLPFTFTYNQEKKEVLIIEGVRENWTPAPVRVLDYQIDFLHTLKTDSPVLANAFVIKNIPYYWKKGKIEKWS